jgi:hypothetical protein
MPRAPAATLIKVWARDDAISHADYQFRLDAHFGRVVPVVAPEVEESLVSVAAPLAPPYGGA